LVIKRSKAAAESVVRSIGTVLEDFMDSSKSYRFSINRCCMGH
jgi:hypothetical protein